MIYQAMGRSAASSAALTRLKALASTDWAYGIACVHAFRGERDDALRLLAQAIALRDPDLWNIKGEPAFRSLTGDARYRQLLDRMKLP